MSDIFGEFDPSKYGADVFSDALQKDDLNDQLEKIEADNFMSNIQTRWDAIEDFAVPVLELETIQPDGFQDELVSEYLMFAELIAYQSDEDIDADLLEYETSDEAADGIFSLLRYYVASSDERLQEFLIPTTNYFEQQVDKERAIRDIDVQAPGLTIGSQYKDDLPRLEEVSTRVLNVLKNTLVRKYDYDGDSDLTKSLDRYSADCELEFEATVGRHSIEETKQKLEKLMETDKKRRSIETRYNN